MGARSRPNHGKRRLGLTYVRKIRICPNHRQRIGVGVARRSDRRQTGCRLNFASVKPLICRSAIVPDRRSPVRGCRYMRRRKRWPRHFGSAGIPERQTRQSAHPDAQFTTILEFFLSELALFLFAIGQGWLGDAGICDKTILSASMRQSLMPTSRNGPGGRVLLRWRVSHFSEWHGRWSQFCSRAWVGSRAHSVGRGVVLSFTRSNPGESDDR